MDRGAAFFSTPKILAIDMGYSSFQSYLEGVGMNKSSGGNGWSSFGSFRKALVPIGLLVGIVAGILAIVVSGNEIAKFLNPPPPPVLGKLEIERPSLDKLQPCEAIARLGMPCTPDGLADAVMSSNSQAIGLYLDAGITGRSKRQGGGEVWLAAAADHAPGLGILLERMKERGVKLTRDCEGCSAFADYIKASGGETEALCEVLAIAPDSSRRMAALEAEQRKEAQRMSAEYHDWQDESTCDRSTSIVGDQAMTCINSAIYDPDPLSAGKCLKRLCRAELKRLLMQYPTEPSYVETGSHMKDLSDFRKIVLAAQSSCAH